MRLALAATVAWAAMAQAAAAMPPKLPAALTMAQGIDMVKGTQNGTKEGVMLLPLFDFHYTQGQVWFCPLKTCQNAQYSIPDELAFVNLDHSLEMINAATIDTYQQWLTEKMNSYSVGVGVSIGEGTQALSANANYTIESFQYKQRTQNDGQSSGFSKHEWAILQLNTYPAQWMPLDPGFTGFLDILPASIKTAHDQKQYNDLVRFYGTHYATSGKFGGRVHVNTFVNKTFLKTVSKEWVSQQFALQFHYEMFQISAGGFTNRSQIHVASKFKQAETTFNAFTGGDVTLQNNEDTAAWLESVPAQPLALNVTMNDISTLISDPSKAAIAANVQKVVKHYIDTGSLPPEQDAMDYDAFYAAIPALPARALSEELPPNAHPQVAARLRANRR